MLKIKKERINLIQDISLFVACILVIVAVIIVPETKRFNESKAYFNQELTKQVTEVDSLASTSMFKEQVMQEEILKANIRIIVVLSSSAILITIIGIQLILIARNEKKKALGDEVM